VNDGISKQRHQIDGMRPTKQRLRESEARFKALVAATGQIVWTTGPDGRVVDIPMWRTFTGQSVEEIFDRGWLDALHPDDRDRVSAVWDKAVETQEVYQTEYRVRRSDGMYRSFTVRAVPVFDDSGLIQEWIGFSTDITDRLQSEYHTKDSLNALLAMAESAVKVSSEPGARGSRTLDESEVARTLAELTTHVLTCKRVSILRVDTVTLCAEVIAVAGPATPPEDECNDYLRCGQSLSVSGVIEELHFGTAVVLDSGTCASPAATAGSHNRSPILLAPMLLGGQLLGLIALDHCDAAYRYDSDQINLALAVARVMALVIERERLLREQAEARATELALRDANHRMDEFLSIASHELRTPLTTIKANIQLAHRRLSSISGLPPDEVVARVTPLTPLLARAERQAGLLNRLAGDLVDVSRIRSGNLELRLDRCDLAAIVRDATYEQRLNNPGRKIGLTLPKAPVPIYADGDRISQVITNFLTNAIKYSPEETPIETTIAVSRGWGRVSVQDEGPGLPPRERKLIWDRFHRVPGVEVVSGSGVGLGLGLHISKSIIERHQGTVGVKSTVGQGSTFWFRLPLAESQQDQSSNR
jgi:PAS domain S-box-containing protein